MFRFRNYFHRVAALSMDLYAENILDHYRHPRGKSPVADATVRHEEKNLSCGDALTVELMLKDGIITDIGWSGDGCAISQAAMSMMAEEITGKSAAEVAAMKPEEVHALLGVPVGPRRFKCALLCLHVLKNALRKTEGKDTQSWTETVAVEEN